MKCSGFIIIVQTLLLYVMEKVSGEYVLLKLLVVKIFTDTTQFSKHITNSGLRPSCKWLHELTSYLLERLSNSCLSATVDLSSSSHITTLMRWEFLMMMGTSSNMFSKPMLAFFKLERHWQLQDRRDKRWNHVCRRRLIVQLHQQFLHMNAGDFQDKVPTILSGPFCFLVVVFPQLLFTQAHHSRRLSAGDALSHR